MLRDEGIAAPPDPPEIAPEEPEGDGIWFSGPDPFPPTARERLEQRIFHARGLARAFVARGLRILADRLEK